MILRDAKGEYRNIGCEVEGCPAEAPPAAELIAGHGLVNMGWRCSGGKHFCPEHADLPVKPTGDIGSAQP